MTLTEIKQQVNCCKFALDDLTTSKTIKQNIYDENNNVIGEKEVPMTDVFKKVVTFLNADNKPVGYCLLNETRTEVLKKDPSALQNATFGIVVSEWGEDRVPLFKIIGKLYSNVFAI